MKNGILQFASTLLIVTFMIAVFPTEEDYRVYEDTLRLHILPNSDSRVDQDLKIGVRDLILDRLGGRLEGADAISSAMMITEDMLEEIQEMADGFLAKAGVDYKAVVALGKEWYETRDYGDFTLPRGYYYSLVITLGEGDGQNWWCILFPPLCTDLACGSSEDENEEPDSIGGNKYSIKFKTLEIIADLFKKKG